MMRSVIHRCQKQTAILSLSGAKTEKIKNIRKQYESFLEEDKKRKERNEYILEKLDKMRCCDSLVPFRSKVQFVNEDNHQIRAYNRLSLNAEAQNDCRVTRPQLNVSQLDIPVKSFDETMLLTEISKKYILIPKLRYSENVATLIANPLTTYADNDWKSKYEILDQLKHKEKEDNQNISTGIYSQKFSQLTDDSQNLKPINVLHEEPERDTYISKKSEDNKVNAKQTCESIFEITTKDDTPLRIDQSSAKTNSSLHSEITSKEMSGSFESVTNDFPSKTEALSKNKANLSEENVSLEHEQNYISSKTNPTEQKEITTGVTNSVTVDIPLQDSSHTQLPNKNDSISQPWDHNNTVSQNDMETDIKQEQQPNIDINETTIVSSVEPSPQDSQDHQEETNEYDGSYGFPAGYNLASTDVHYQYGDNTQEYYIDPNVNQEYEYNDSQCYNENYNPVNPSHENADAQYFHHENTEQNGNETFYLEPQIAQEDTGIPTTVGDYIDDVKVPANEEIPDGKDYAQEKTDDVDLAENLTFKEGIEEFEAEQTELFGQNDGVRFPDTFAADVVIGGSIAQENLNNPVEEYSAIYQGQITQNPLDNNDYDATLQQYDPSYEAQYTGNYEEVETAITEHDVSYDPEEVHQLEYETENMLDIEEQLDTEQGYVLEEVMTSQQNAQGDVPVEQPNVQVKESQQKPSN